MARPSVTTAPAPPVAPGGPGSDDDEDGGIFFSSGPVSDKGSDPESPLSSSSGLPPAAPAVAVPRRRPSDPWTSAN